MDFPKFVKPVPPEGITESVFQCKRGELKVGGTEYRPQGDNLPIAIVSHGFMANQDTTRQYAIWLSELGYAAFCFDFCGGSAMPNESDGKTTDMSVLTEVEDIKAVVEYTASLSYTDGSRVVLMGCSQGGFVSALAAAELGDRIDRIVLYYPALCIPDDARRGQMMFARFDPKDIPETVQCGPMLLGRRYVTDVIEMDPFEKIAAYPGQVLIVHGTKDDLVLPVYAERANEAYLASIPEGMSADERVKLVLLEGAPHGFSGEQDIEAFEHVKEFLK